ncbi:transmembrane protease serine 9-like [Rhinoraja longicauda]
MKVSKTFLWVAAAVGVILLFASVAAVILAKYYTKVAPHKQTMDFPGVGDLSSINETCGSRIERFSRIVGGTNAVNGEWPWQVSLQIGSHVCGASIISDQWLVSAAHCFQNAYANPSVWEAYMGSVLVGEGMSSTIRRIRTHPNYSVPKKFTNDIAVLELSSPLIFNDFIQPICLPPSSKVFPPGQRCTITGWGTLAFEGSLATILQKAVVHIISSDKCKHVYKTLITENMICAGIMAGGVDACQGDSGGPLVCRDPDKTWFLAGIVSYGIKCASPNIPGVYSRVTSLRDWRCNDATNVVFISMESASLQMALFWCNIGDSVMRSLVSASLNTCSHHHHHHQINIIAIIITITIIIKSSPSSSNKHRHRHYYHHRHHQISVQEPDGQVPALKMKISKCFVATVVIISTLLVLAAVAVIILAIFLTKAASSQTWNSYYRGNFRILNIPYNESLASSSSMEFFDLADDIERQLNSVYSTSDFSKEFSRAQVVEFSSGSVVVELVLQYRGNGSIPASLVEASQLAFQQSLTQVDTSTQTGLLNHFLIDVNSINFTVSLGGSVAPDSSVAASTDVPTQPTSDSILRTTGITPHTTVANINITTGTTIGCGTRTSSKIVGGTNAANGEWPWQVSLQIGRHICGASIISDRWLISAAHCFRSPNNPSRWQAYMGSVQVGNGTSRNIRRIIIHPRYAVINANDYDVAVLELSNPLTFSSLIQPICLPSSEQVFPAGQQCAITGWGTLAYQGSLPNILQEADVKVIDDRTCRNIYRSLITGRMLCAGVLEGGVDSCQGDSGGPLSCRESAGSWFLAGIVSFGNGCALPDFPGVYTRVTAVRQWVQQQTGV